MNTTSVTYRLKPRNFRKEMLSEEIKGCIQEQLTSVYITVKKEDEALKDQRILNKRAIEYEILKKFLW